MKIKNVQMRINPELYAKFKLVDGDGNNERMTKLLIDSKEKYILVRDVNYHKVATIEYQSMYLRERSSNKTLASALAISIAISALSVAYVCVVNGWFS